MTDLNSIKNMSFEEAINELDVIVKKIDSGQQSLEDSITAYERGSALKKHCEEKLKEAKLKVEKITQDSQGNFTTEPVTINEEN